MGDGDGGGGRFFHLSQRFRRTDGVVGLIDLRTRRLLSDPRARLLALAKSPDVLD